MKTEIYKKKLEEEKVVVENELKDIARKDKDTGKWEAVPEDDRVKEADENDMADQNEEYTERTGIADSLNKRIKDIEDALEKIEKGTYGKCEVCGEKIEEERLEANPAARTCIEHM